MSAIMIFGKRERDLLLVSQHYENFNLCHCFYFLMQCLDGTGETEEALTCMKKASMLDPQNKVNISDIYLTLIL